MPSPEIILWGLRVGLRTWRENVVIGLLKVKRFCMLLRARICLPQLLK